MSEPQVINNPAQNRFEVQQAGLLAVLNYRREDQTIVLEETQVPSELEGQGIGSALTRAGLEYARAEGLAVNPVCSFVQRYLTRHPEYGDLVK